MADEERQQRDPDAGSQRHHFLIVAFGVQSHVNPGRALARRLVRLGDGAVRATLCVSTPTHRRMFPWSPSAEEEEDDEATDGVVSYVAYSDGLADGAWPKDDKERARSRRAGAASISAVIARLAKRGQPVTCLMCTMVLPCVLDVASQLGVPLAVFWIQPAHLLAAYYHYHHGYGDLIASLAAAAAGTDDEGVSLPGLTRPLRIRDFPSFLVDTTDNELTRALNDAMRELMEFVDRRRPKLLVNTFDALEPGVMADMQRRSVDVVAVGPVVESAAATEEEARIHLFAHDAADRKRYVDWLDAQPEESVVYASFGSISKYKRKQVEEIVHGLKQCGRPYLLVVRKDTLEQEEDKVTTSSVVLDETVQNQQDQQGMVVEWCDQVEVLSHPSMGCFVTHCGWNSTLEAIASGVPIVAAPNMFDQPTIAYLAEEEWEIGTRTERDGEGILTETELARCIDLVMGDGEKARCIRERAKALKGLAQEAAAAGGHAERNLREFVETI